MGTATMGVLFSEQGQIERLIGLLESIIEGNRAAEELIAIGPRAIPELTRFLLESTPRALAHGRCRAVKALGELGACSSLLSYLSKYKRPADAAVLFAEDAVRSAAARELLHCEQELVFPALLNALRERATSGLVEAVGESRRPEAVPIFFGLFEDDLCREDAMMALRKVPEAARAYAVLLLRGQTGTLMEGSVASRQRRATLQLLAEWGAGASEWPELRGYLWDEDPDCVIAAARLGFRADSESVQEEVVEALIEGATKMNGAQEMETVEVLDEHTAIACSVAARVVARRRLRGERPSWVSPCWRIMHHFLGRQA